MKDEKTKNKSRAAGPALEHHFGTDQILDVESPAQLKTAPVLLNADTRHQGRARARSHTTSTLFAGIYPPLPSPELLQTSPRGRGTLASCRPRTPGPLAQVKF
jgi:hypothetical protein